MNNQLNDFSRDASSVNSIEPGKIPLSSMPGGLMIWPSLVQVIQNYIDYEMELEDALNTPRICARSDFFYYDAGLPDALRLGLDKMGYSSLSPRQSIARPVGLAWNKNGQIIGSAERNSDVAVFNDGVSLVQQK